MFLVINIVFLSQSVCKGQTLNSKEKGIPMIERSDIKPIVFRFDDSFSILGRRYVNEMLEIDSVHVNECIGMVINVSDSLVFSPDVNTELYGSSRIFSIRDIHNLNYVVKEYESQMAGSIIKRYSVYATDRNENDKAIVEKMAKELKDRAKELKDRIEEAERKAEEERQYILDNPWPNRVVFEGESYTRPENNGSIWIEDIDELLSTTTSQVIREGAFPKN